MTRNGLANTTHVSPINAYHVSPIMPHGFNVTNIHYHGFHVSPNCSPDGTVCADNVLIELEPGES